MAEHETAFAAAQAQEERDRPSATLPPRPSQQNGTKAYERVPSGNDRASGMSMTGRETSTISMRSSARALDPEINQHFDERMKGMSKRVKDLGNVMSPWRLVGNKQKAKKLSKSIEEEREEVTEMMNEMMLAYQEAQKVAEEAQEICANSEATQAQQEELAREHEEKMKALQQEMERLKELQQARNTKTRTLLEHVDVISSKQATKPFTYSGHEGDEQEALEERVEFLLEIQDGMASAAAEKEKAAKAELEKKLADFQSKATAAAVAQEKEAKQAQLAMKRLEEQKEEEVEAMRKTFTEQMEKKTKDMELMAQRVKSAKAEAEGYKAREKATKAALDEVCAGLQGDTRKTYKALKNTVKLQLSEAQAASEKAQEEVKVFKSRMAAVRASKEVLTKELNMAHYEQEVLAAEYHELIHMIADSQGLQAIPCADLFVKHTAPFPRTAFTMGKNGKVLYNRAVHKEIDANAVVPLEYNNHKELLQLLAEKGLVLDRQCGAETF